MHLKLDFVANQMYNQLASLVFEVSGAIQHGNNMVYVGTMKLMNILLECFVEPAKRVFDVGGKM